MVGLFAEFADWVQCSKVSKSPDRKNSLVTGVAWSVTEW